MLDEPPPGTDDPPLPSSRLRPLWPAGPGSFKLSIRIVGEAFFPRCNPIASADPEFEAGTREDRAWGGAPPASDSPAPWSCRRTPRSPRDTQNPNPEDGVPRSPGSRSSPPCPHRLLPRPASEAMEVMLGQLSFHPLSYGFCFSAFARRVPSSWDFRPSPSRLRSGDLSSGHPASPQCCPSLPSLQSPDPSRLDLQAFHFALE